jgi:hypothetical protein
VLDIIRVVVVGDPRRLCVVDNDDTSLGCGEVDVNANVRCSNDGSLNKNVGTRPTHLVVVQSRRWAG